MIWTGTAAQQGTEENDTQRCDGHVVTIDSDAPWPMSLALVRLGVASFELLVQQIISYLFRL